MMCTRAVVLLLLVQKTLGFMAGGMPNLGVRRMHGALASNPDGMSQEEMIKPGEAIKKLKKEMEEAQAKGDIDTVVTLMGTLLAMEGAYENEAGEDDDQFRSRISTEGKCAD